MDNFDHAHQIRALVIWLPLCTPRPSCGPAMSKNLVEGSMLAEEQADWHRDLMSLDQSSYDAGQFT